MQHLYSAKFSIGEDGNIPDLERVLGTVAGWVDPDNFPEVDFDEFGSGVDVSAEGFMLRTYCREGAFRMRYGQPDRFKGTWIVEFSLSHEAGKAHEATVDLRYDGELPSRGVIGRPRLIKDLVFDYPCFGSYRLDTKAEVFEHADDFLSEREDDKRDLPLVLVSWEPNGRAVNPNKLQDKVLGIGYVVCPVDEREGFELDSRLGERSRGVKVFRGDGAITFGYSSLRRNGVGNIVNYLAALSVKKSP